MKSKEIKILIFIDWFYPAYKAGGPIRSVSNIINQYFNDFKFFIITSDRDKGDQKAFENVRLNTWIKTHETYEVIYLSPDKQRIKNYLNLINEINPDKLYLNSLFSLKFTLYPILANRSFKNKIKVILAPRGMLGDGALNIKKVKKHTFLKLSRIFGFFNNINWHASTIHEEKEILKYFGKNVQVKVAENLASLPIENKIKKRKLSEGILNILFVSRISVKKNLSFLLEAIASSKRKTNIELNIVGPVEDISYLNTCLKYAKNHGIRTQHYNSVKPNEMLNFFNQSDIFSLPTFHENYGHVIIEALSYGMPVLISKNTPWRNLDQKNIGFDEELEIQKFANRIDYFYELNDHDFRKMSENAIMYAEKIINNKQVIQDNYDLFMT